MLDAFNNAFSKISLFAILLIFGCDNKGCQELVCATNQTCRQGNCICIDGYEGENCLDFAYLKYEGSNYNVSESCSQGAPHNVFFGSIIASVNPVNRLEFPNFLNTGQTAIAFIGTDVNGAGNYIRFNSQNLGGSAFTIAGEGRYEDFGGFNRIIIDIQSTEFGQAKLCTLTYQ